MDEENLNQPAAAEPAPAEPPQGEPVSVQNEPAQPQQTPAIRIEIDERTGRRRVVRDTPEPPKPEPAKPEPQPIQTPPATQEPPQPTLIQKLTGEEPKPAFYSPEEMALAMQLKSVDESRIPPQYKAQYEAVKPQPAPQPDLASQIRQKIQDMAKAEAMKRSGATEDDLELGEFSDDAQTAERVRDYRTYYEIAQQNIIRDMNDRYRAMQAEQQARKEVYQGVNDFVKSQQKTEPHFAEISQRMETEFKRLPYEKAAVIVPAIQSAQNGTLSEAQAQVLGNYYELCRKEFYADLNGTSTTPTPKVPSVERRGAGENVAKRQDFAQLLRNANVKDKPGILAAWIHSSAKENN